MADIVLPVVGQSGWGPVVNDAIVGLNTEQNDGRLSPDSLDSAYGAAAVSNPETPMNDAVSQAALAAITSSPDLSREIYIGADTGASRPAWVGPVTWITTVDAQPSNALTGDSYKYVEASIPWSPADLDGLMGWYEPADLTPGSVATWADRSPAGRDLTANGSPLADASGLNGHPGVILDGASGFASELFTQQDNNGPITVFVNAQFGALSTGGTKQLLFNGQNSTNPSLAAIRGDHPSTASLKNRWGYGRASSSTYAGAQSADQAVHRFILFTDLADSKLSVDDTDYALGTAGSAQITQFQIGQQAAATNAMIGVVGTIFWVVGRPDDATIANAVAYLNAQAGRS